MSLLKKLAIEGVMLLSLLGEAKATYFNSVTSWNNPISISGRLDFLDNSFKSFAKQGDEVGFLRWDSSKNEYNCIGSSNFIDEKQSHYFDLKLPQSVMNDVLNGTKGIYYIQAFNCATNTLWDVKIMNYNISKNQINFQAINPTPIYEPTTLVALGLGAIALNQRKRK